MGIPSAAPLRPAGPVTDLSEPPLTEASELTANAEDSVISERRSKFARAFARGDHVRAIVTTPLRFQSWVPEAVRQDVLVGYGHGTRITLYAVPEGPDIVVWSREGSDQRELEIMRYAPEDSAPYLEHTRGDADLARRLVGVATAHNRDLRHLVEEIGLSPSEARRFVQEVDGQVFRIFLEAVAMAFASPAGPGRVPSLAATRRPSAGRVIQIRRQTVIGAAEGPADAFTRNAAGPRTTTEARRLAERHGIEFPEDVELYFVEGRAAEEWIPNGAYANYMNWSSISADRRVTWGDLITSRGVIPVRIRREVLDSDEAIVGILAHEAYELRELERLLGDGRSIHAAQLARLINDRRNGGLRGNLHEQAWDEANRLIERMKTK